MRAPSKEIEVAIFFSDINNYTAFAESLPARKVIEILDFYFRQMGDIVEDHEGGNYRLCRGWLAGIGMH